MRTEFYDTLCTAAVCSYFIPMLIVLIRGLWHDSFFRWFAIYWAWGGLINSIDLIPGFPGNIAYTIGVANNMLDIPFILLIFYCTSRSIYLRRFVAAALSVVVLSESIALISNGFNFEALKYPVGLGILTVLATVGWEIIRYARRIEHTNRQNAMVFVHAALLFEFGTFILIYIFDYFVTHSEPQDSFLIYYISTLVAILIASCGYLLFRKYENKVMSYVGN